MLCGTKRGGGDLGGGDLGGGGVGCPGDCKRSGKLTRKYSGLERRIMIYIDLLFLTLGACASEGYSSWSVCVCVCVSVRTKSASTRI